MKSIVILLLCMAGSMLQAQIIHVPVDYPTIQQGIEAAIPGDTVLVANGTYFERISFMGKKPLMVASEFILDGDWSHIPLTIIDGGTPPYPSNSSVVSFVSGEDTTSVLCGFTIKNGKGTLYESAGWLTKAGGGIFIKNSGAKIIRNHITQNHLTNSPLGNNIDAYDGAGIAVAWFDNSDWVIIENNTVDYNSCVNNTIESGGAGIWLSCNARIKDNLVSNNACTGQESCYSAGAGIWCNNSPDPNSSFTLFVQGNTISSNHAVADNNYAAHGGAVFAHVTSVFLDNHVTGNEAHDNYTASGGVGGVSMIYPKEGTMVSGNTFSGNISEAWGGALNFETEAGDEVNFRIVVENNYFLDNKAANGGAITCANVPLNIQNNVFRGNTASNVGGAVLLSKNMALSFHHMAEMVNNSFFKNSADHGGAIYSSYAKPLVFNSIYWKDIAAVGPEIYAPFIYDTVEIANSDIDFGLIYGKINDGGANINQDPLYDDLDLLTLLTNSPCLDDGIKTFICDCGVAHTCPGYDISGIPRPQSGGVEMGAYELLFNGVKPLTVVSRQSSVVSCYPNPANDIVDFRLSMVDCRNVVLMIYDVNGKEVATVLEKHLPAGEHKVQFNASGLPAGIYFYELSAKGIEHSADGKLIIQR